VLASQLPKTALNGIAAASPENLKLLSQRKTSVYLFHHASDQIEGDGPNYQKRNEV
jgi:hypothetical protein